MTNVILTDIKNIPIIDGKSIITIGMFDSFHKYHKLIIKKTQEVGEENNLLKIILTFDKKPNKNVKNLLEIDEKTNFIKKNFNFDYIIVLKADENLVRTSSEKFISILKKNFKVSKIVEGSDFTFGFEKKGNIKVLQNEFGNSNVIVFERNNSFSSTKIKEKIFKSNLDI